LNREEHDIGLAYQVILTPRTKPEAAATIYKTIEKGKKDVLKLKSFSLERNFQEINVMQARNYLKKPYKKPGTSSKASSKKRSKLSTKLKHTPSATDELANVEDIFEKKESGIKKNELSEQEVKSSQWRLAKYKNSLNNGFNIFEED
jgi:hypothetical protein